MRGTMWRSPKVLCAKAPVACQPPVHMAYWQAPVPIFLPNCPGDRPEPGVTSLRNPGPPDPSPHSLPPLSTHPLNLVGLGY